MKLYKVAVCLSGEPRHWKHCVANIKAFFEKTACSFSGLPVHVDYFIHTWDTNTWRHLQQKGEIVSEKINDPVQLKIDICNAFGAKDIEIETPNDVFPTGLKYAWDSMFYSNMKAVLMKRNYELTNDFQYDCVIKARLDLIFNPTQQFSYNKLAPLRCYAGHMGKFPGEFNSNNFDDIIFYGDSPTMDLVSDIYFTNEKLMESPAVNPGYPCDINIIWWLGPGCQLYEHLVRLGIYPCINNFIDYTIFRTTMIGKNLNIDTDYHKLKQLFFDWYK